MLRLARKKKKKKYYHHVIQVCPSVCSHAVKCRKMSVHVASHLLRMSVSVCKRTSNMDFSINDGNLN